MSKPKALLKQGKHKPKTKREQVLETADDFQAAGVDFSEAGGKWRAGDAAKSLRFFQRAVDVYDQGLQKFPRSLDLAYNKAQVLLEIATHPVLVRQLQIPILSALDRALIAHRYALDRDPNDANTLFNTAQLMTTIAEEIAKDDTHSDQDALPFLEEALELQSRCLSIQELRYEQEQTETEQMMNTSPPPEDRLDSEPKIRIEDSTASSKSTAEDQWFAIVEPTTIDTLIDTVLAQLATLTTMCGILGSLLVTSPNINLAWIEEFSAKLQDTKIAVYKRLMGSERLPEIALVNARLMTAMLDAGYRLRSIDVQTYKRERDAAFDVPELDLDKSFEGLALNAESLMAYNTALADYEDYGTTQSSSRWNALSTAIANLATASKLPGAAPHDVAKTHFMRGDCSLLQLQMREPPISHSSAQTNSAQLLKNAEVFYKNSSRLDPDKEASEIAGFRSVVARSLASGGTVPSGLTQDYLEHGSEWTLQQLRIMIEEGLLSSSVSLA